MAKILISDPITPAGIELFKQAGFEVEAGYGSMAGRYARKPLTFDDFEIMIVARKKVLAAN